MSRRRTDERNCLLRRQPERIQPEDPGCPTYDVRADVWSLGITLVELALRQFPYKADSDFEVLSKIMSDPPPSLPRGRFSDPFCDFVECCLLKEVRNRPKYRKLLDHPFIKHFDETPVDVAAWFALIAPQ